MQWDLRLGDEGHLVTVAVAVAGAGVLAGRDDDGNIAAFSVQDGDVHQARAQV